MQAWATIPATCGAVLAGGQVVDDGGGGVGAVEGQRHGGRALQGGAEGWEARLDVRVEVLQSGTKVAAWLL